MKVRTLIVDDEPLARERMRSLLSEEPDVEVVGEAADGIKAVLAIEEQKPDVVFLDVEIPNMDGFHILQSVGSDRIPAIVFVTAHDQYALRAFDVRAVDYVLKPFGRERLQKALERAREQITREKSSDLSGQLVALIEEMRPTQRFLKRIPPGFSVGIVAFSSTPSVASPVTTDRTVTRAAVGYLLPETGTAIGDGLALAVKVGVAARRQQQSLSGAKTPPREIPRR